MNNDIHIRAAEIDDVPIILFFIQALADYEKLSHEVVATEDDLRMSLFGDPKAKQAEVIIASSAGKDIGFALYFHTYSTFLGRAGMWLEDLFVLPEARGTGAGKKLLSHLAKIAKDRQCGRLEWSVLNWNEPSIKFYRSLGATPMDEWTTYRLHGQALDDLANS